jgi:hypothetical protein
LTGTADFGDGVSASISSLTPVTAKAHGPGEVSGPGIEVKVRLVNGRNAPISLDSVVINVFADDGAPGSPMSQSSAPPFTGALGAHQAKTGTYLFTVPIAHRSPITVNFSYSAGAPVVLFVGNR